MRVAAISDDLMWGSKVIELIRDGGHDVKLIAPAELSAVTPPLSLSDIDVMVIDLGSQGFDGVELDAVKASVSKGGRVRVLGVYSHVDVETKTRAEAAGFDLVVPRSRMMREGSKLVEGL